LAIICDKIKQRRRIRAGCNNLDKVKILSVILLLQFEIIYFAASF
jgi:hypothetical protein